MASPTLGELLDAAESAFAAGKGDDARFLLNQAEKLNQRQRLGESEQFPEEMDSKTLMTAPRIGESVVQPDGRVVSEVPYGFTPLTAGKQRVVRTPSGEASAPSFKEDVKVAAKNLFLPRRSAAPPSMVRSAGVPPRPQSMEEMDAETRDEVTKRYDKAIKERGGMDRVPVDLRAALYREITEEIDRERAKVITPDGVVSAVNKTALQPFRPTRIEVVRPMESRPVFKDNGDPLKDSQGNQIYEEVPVKGGKATRMYRTEAGGLIEPSAWMELKEAAAQQPVLMKSEADAIARAIALGEQDAPRLRGLMSERDPKFGGMVETSLGAVLRAVPAALENIVSDAYFKGLGYEVDEQGNPLDKSDFGYKIAQVRKKLGLPAVSLRFTTPLPLPGVATRREEGQPGGEWDPRTRKKVEDVPWGQRIARSVTAGRTLADDMQDAPEVLQAYKDLYGEEYGATAAGLAGTAVSMFIPTGVVSGPKALLKLGKMAGKVKKVSAAANAIGTGVQQGFMAARSVPKLLPDGAHWAVRVPVQAAGYVVGKAGDAAALVSPTPVANARIIARTAERMAPDVPFSKAARLSGDPQKFTDEAFEHWAPASELFVPGGDEFQSAAAAARSRKATLKVEALRGELARAIPDDLVVVSDMFAVPRNIAGDVFSKVAEDLQKLPKGSSVEDIARARDAAVLKHAPEAARRLDELGEFQVTFDRLGREVLEDKLFVRRAFAMLRDLPPARRASVAKAVREIEGAASEAFRNMTKDLEGLTKRGMSLDEALDAVASRELSKMEPREFWKKMVEENYGGGPDAEAILLRIEEAGVDTSTFPTLDAIRKADGLPSVREKAPGLIPPKFQGNMLKIILEEGVRKRVSKEALENYIRVFQKGPDTLSPEFAAGFLAMRPAEAVIKDTPAGRVAFSLAEEKFAANGGEEFFKALDSIPTKKRGTEVLRLFSELNAIRKASFRGWDYQFLGIPRVDFLFGRALSAPIIAAAQIGLDHSLGGGRAVLNRFLGRGAGPYTASQVTELIRKYGVGSTSVDQGRLGRLGQDILDDALRAGKVTPERALLYANPATKGWAERMAHSIERVYREGVFADQLAKGASPLEASEIAKKSLWDYSRTPGAFRDRLGSVFATAAESYNAGMTFMDVVARDPNKITQAVKILRAKQQAQDPYGYYGDKGLKSLGIYRAGRKGQEVAVLGPRVPLFEPIETTLGLLYVASTVQSLFRSEDLVDAATAVGRAGADKYIPGVWAAFNGVANSLGSKYQTAAQVEELSKPSDETAFWNALLAADLADPSRDGGIWDTTWSILDPIQVNPPDGSEVPEDPTLWREAPPEGMPYLFEGVSASGLPMYRVLRPSRRGTQNIKAIRALTPDMVHRAFGAVGSLMFSSAGPQVDISAIQPPGMGGAAATFLGLESAGPADKALRERKRAAQVIEQAESN